jgi:hypothetical protein
MLAAGGILAEIHRDRSLRLAPVDLAEAKAMIGEVAALKALAAIAASRGRSRCLGAGAGALSRLACGQARRRRGRGQSADRPAEGRRRRRCRCLVQARVGGQSHDRTNSDLVNADANLVRRGRYLSTTFCMEIGEQGYLIKIIEGRIVSVTPGPFVTPNYSFALRAPRDEWEMFWKKVPTPAHNDIFALFKRGKLTIEGDLHPFMANLLYIKDVLAAAASIGGEARRPAVEPALRAHYRPLSQSQLLGRPHRLYFEEAGQGIRCCACTPPAPTAGSIADCSTTSASPTTIASSCSICPGTENLRRRKAIRTRNTS